MVGDTPPNDGGAPVPAPEVANLSDNLRVVPRCLADIKRELAREARSWEGDAETSQQTMDAALDLALGARSACCLVVAPPGHVESLHRYSRRSDDGRPCYWDGRHLESPWYGSPCYLDGGYLTGSFQGKQISHPELQRAFAQFTDPETTVIEAKDGAVIFSSSGLLVAGAVEFVDLPEARFIWPEHGERHTTALQVTSLFEQVVVFVKSDEVTSDDGSVMSPFYVLFGRPDSMVEARHEVPPIGLVTNMGGNHMCGFVFEDSEKRLIELKEDIAGATGIPVDQVGLMRGMEFLADAESLVLEGATIDAPAALTMIQMKQQVESGTTGDKGDDKSEDPSSPQHEQYDPAVGPVVCPDHGSEDPREDCRTCQTWVTHMDQQALDQQSGERPRD